MKKNLSYKKELLDQLAYTVEELDEFNDATQDKHYDKPISGFNALDSLFYHVSKTGKILDIGCGSGAILTEFPFTDAIEPNKNRLNSAKKNNKCVNFEQGFIENLPYEDNTFDVIVCWGTFCFVRSPMEALIEVSRVLRKEGLFVFDVVISTNLPIAQTVEIKHFTTKYLPLFGFNIIKRMGFCDPKPHYRLGMSVIKETDFNPKNLLLPQVVDGKLINYDPKRDWFLQG